jgi:hypothetical protein
MQGVHISIYQTPSSNFISLSINSTKNCINNNYLNIHNSLDTQGAHIIICHITLLYFF